MAFGPRKRNRLAKKAESMSYYPYFIPGFAVGQLTPSTLRFATQVASQPRFIIPSNILQAVARANLLTRYQAFVQAVQSAPASVDVSTSQALANELDAGGLPAQAASVRNLLAQLQASRAQAVQGPPQRRCNGVPGCGMMSDNGNIFDYVPNGTLVAILATGTQRRSSLFGTTTFPVSRVRFRNREGWVYSSSLGNP